MFAYNATKAARALVGFQCTIAMFLVVSANSVLWLAGTEELGGLGDLRARIDAQSAAGDNRIEIGNKVGIVSSS
jgi:hypothetical protein